MYMSRVMSSSCGLSKRPWYCLKAGSPINACRKYPQMGNAVRLPCPRAPVRKCMLRYSPPTHAPQTILGLTHMNHASEWLFDVPVFPPKSVSCALLTYPHRLCDVPPGSRMPPMSSCCMKNALLYGITCFCSSGAVYTSRPSLSTMRVTSTGSACFPPLATVQ